jgi:hypothetical protein
LTDAVKGDFAINIGKSNTVEVVPVVKNVFGEGSLKPI